MGFRTEAPDVTAEQIQVARQVLRYAAALAAIPVDAAKIDAADEAELRAIALEHRHHPASRRALELLRNVS